MSRLSIVNALDNTHSDLGGSYLKLLFKVASILMVLSGQSCASPFSFSRS